MKKFLSFMLIFTFITVIFSGCGKEPQNIPNSAERTDVTQKTQTTDFNTSDGYKLSKAELVSESRLILTYTNSDKDTCMFRQYDLKSKLFTHQSEEFSMNDFNLRTICFLSNNFYILSENTCFVFDFNCNLVQKFPVPKKVSGHFGMASYWLSDDLKLTAYVKNSNFEADYLYIADSNGQNEKQIRMLGADLTITDLFFSEKSDYLGIEGVTIPQGKDESVDCYGYINLKNNETTFFQDDNTYMTHQGDIMLICDETAEYGAPRRGFVKTFDLKTKDRKEIKMKLADECEAANLASDSSYLVGMHKEESNHSFAFTIYKNGKEVNSANYVCPTEQTYTDISSSATELRMDMETKQIMAFYYDNTQNGYSILFIPFK